MAFTDDMESLFCIDSTIGKITGNVPPCQESKVQVVAIKEEPFIASLLSENALKGIRSLEFEIQEDVGKRGIEKLHIPDELVKAALVLSHSKTVAVHFGFPCNTNAKYPDEVDGPPGFLAICKALLALGKMVSCIASSYQVDLVRELVIKFLEDRISVLEFKPEKGKGVKTAAEEFLFFDGADELNPKFDTLVAIEATSRTIEGAYMTMKGRNLIYICEDSPVDELFIQGNSFFYT